MPHALLEDGLVEISLALAHHASDVRPPVHDSSHLSGVKSPHVSVQGDQWGLHGLGYLHHDKLGGDGAEPALHLVHVSLDTPSSHWGDVHLVYGLSPQTLGLLT